MDDPSLDRPRSAAHAAVPWTSAWPALNWWVAGTADAWLADPQDTGVYTRLVEAIRARRSYLNPTLDLDPAEDPAPAQNGPDDPEIVPPPQLQPDEVLDGLGERQPVRRLTTCLGDDPRALLDRLRQGMPRG